MRNKIWTKEEEEKLKNLVGTGNYSFKQLEFFFKGRTKFSLQLKARQLKINNKYKRVMYTYNRNFFENPNLINSFFAGWIAADGSIGIKPKTGIYYFAWGMHSQDRRFLEIFREKIQSNGVIDEFLHFHEKNPNNKQLHCKFRLHNLNQMARHLKDNFSIIPNKTHCLAPPNNLTLENKLAYLIGYINGDGCISKQTKANSITISIVSSSIDIISWIYKIIEDLKLPTVRNKKISISKYNGYNRIAICGLKAIYLIDILKKIDVPILDRKWNNPDVQKYVHDQKMKHPEWFSITIDEIFSRLGLRTKGPDMSGLWPD